MHARINYVGKTQVCMVSSGRLIPHAPVQRSRYTHSWIRHQQEEANSPDLNHPCVHQLCRGALERQETVAGGFYIAGLAFPFNPRPW